MIVIRVSPTWRLFVLSAVCVGSIRLSEVGLLIVIICLHSLGAVPIRLAYLLPLCMRMPSCIIACMPCLRDIVILPAVCACCCACRYERHTKHCPQCQEGMKLVQAAANAAAVAGVLLAIFAAAAAVAAKTLAAPGVVVAALLAGGCAWVRERLLEFRHTQFISSKYQWQKTGGLSLVKGDPVKVVSLSTE